MALPVSIKSNARDRPINLGKRTVPPSISGTPVDRGLIKFLTTPQQIEQDHNYIQCNVMYNFSIEFQNLDNII